MFSALRTKNPKRLGFGTRFILASFVLTQLLGSVFAQSVKLAWDPNAESHVAGYNVYRSEQAGVFTSAPVNGTSLITTTTFTDSTAQSGRIYHYVVKAVASDGSESPASNMVTPPSQTPIGWWKLDEASGKAASDAAGNNSGSLLNNAGWNASGRVAGALSLQGMGQGVKIPGLMSNPTNVTLAGWANLATAGWEGATLVSIGDYVAIRLDDFMNQATGFFYDGETWNGTGLQIRYAGSGWHHFAYTVDSINHVQTLYVDGVAVATTTHATQPAFAGLGQDTFIGIHGAGATSYDFGGKIDDVRIYNRPLSAAEVQAIVASAAPANKAPIVNVGADQTISLPAKANLVATATDDNLPNGTLAYQWSVVSGSGVTFTNASAASTQATFAAAGTFVLRMTVTDGQLAAFDDITVTVKPANKAPVVNAGADQTITLPSTASLTVTATDDNLPNNTLTYQWTVVSGTGVTFANASAASTQATFAAAGTFVLKATVSDGALSASDELTVTVKAANKAPVANAGPDQTITLPSKATLAATATDDNLPNNTLTYQWTVVSGTGVTFANAASANTDATFAAAGTFVLKVTVSDGALTSSDNVSITVKAANKAPVVNAGADQTITLPSKATLAAIATDDNLPNNTLTYQWTVVSGTGATIASPTAATTQVTFASAGTVTFRISVSDGALSSTDDIVVIVKSAPAANQAPVANAGADQAITLPSNAMLSATATDDNLPNNTLTFQWSVVSGTGVAFKAPTSASTEVTFTAAGIFTLRVTVSDGALSSTDDVVVTVNAAPADADLSTLTLIVSKKGQLLQNPNNPILVESTDSRVEGVELYIDGKLTAASVGTSLRYRWDTRKKAGTHTIEAIGYDAEHKKVGEAKATVVVK